MCLTEALISQNFRTPGTIDASLFTVCTLNVDGLPAYDFVNNDGPDTKYTPVISRYLADHNFDFIGVQENFDFDQELGRYLTANYDHDSWAGGMSPNNLFDDGDYLGWTIRGEMPDKILYINPVGGHSVELLSCEYDNSKQTRAYYKDGGDEPLGDHFPLFAKFRLKN